MAKRPRTSVKTTRSSIRVSQGTNRVNRGQSTRRIGGVPPIPASITLGSANSGRIYTAKTANAAGNSIRVRVVVAGASTALSVSVSGNDITVNSATDAGSLPTTTASQAIAAVNGNGPASALVTGSLASGSNGTGVIAAAGFTNLSGGRDAS